MPTALPPCFGNTEIYTPIQCGREINPPLPGILGDDTGDNISRLNVRYNEMTAIYWIARHLGEIGDPEYIGFDHYRRFLNWRESMLSPCNVIARKWFSWRTLRGQYACCHNIEDLDRFSIRFKEVFGTVYNDYDAYWRSHFFYICNMFIMHRDNFRRYADYIIKCIEILKGLESEKPFSTTDAYQQRAPGFILEAMTSYWLWHEKRHKNIKIIPTKITHYNIENAANGWACLNRRGLFWRFRQAY